MPSGLEEQEQEEEHEQEEQEDQQLSNWTHAPPWRFQYLRETKSERCGEQSMMTRKSMGRHEMGQHINLMVDAKATAREDIYSEGVQS